MKIHAVLTNNFKKEDISEIDINNTICAVIDTIRATSTIVTMIGCGADSVIIAEHKKEALRLKELFPESILCGEEGGLAPEGFDYGNSPFEISSIDNGRKNYILMTTNGTKSILRVKDFRDIFVLSILNLNFVLDMIARTANSVSSDILLLCSGEKGRIAYDDVYTAGLAVKYLLTRPNNFEFTDAAKLVLSAALSEFDINCALEKSISAKSLCAVSADCRKDILFLSNLNFYRVAPKLIKTRTKDINLKKAGIMYTGKPGSDYLYIVRNNL